MKRRASTWLRARDVAVRSTLWSVALMGSAAVAAVGLPGRYDDVDILLLGVMGALYGLSDASGVHQLPLKVRASGLLIAVSGLVLTTIIVGRPAAMLWVAIVVIGMSRLAARRSDRCQCQPQGSPG